MNKNINHNSTPHPIRGDKGATDEGPRNIERDLQNPDMIVPPATDGGTLDNMKFSYYLVCRRLLLEVRSYLDFEDLFRYFLVLRLLHLCLLLLDVVLSYDLYFYSYYNPP